MSRRGVLAFISQSLVAFAEALDEAHRRAREVELRAKLIFEEALVAEMQRRFLVREDQERRRRGLCLGDVVDAHGARLGRAAALQIDILSEPAIQLWGGNAPAARIRHLIDQRKELLRALACFRGEKNDRRI